MFQTVSLVVYLLTSFWFSRALLLFFPRLRSWKSNQFLLDQESDQQWWSKKLILRITFVSRALIFFSFCVISPWRCANYIWEGNKSTFSTLRTECDSWITYIFFNFLLKSLCLLSLSLDLEFDCDHFISVHGKIKVQVSLLT